MILPNWFSTRSDDPKRPKLLRRLDAADPAENLNLLKKPDSEWLSTNRGGSFAMGTIDRLPRRKYHGLLTVREPGVGEPLNVVAELEEWFEIDGQQFALHSYDWGNAIAPRGFQYLVGFESTPRWTYDLDGVRVTRELWLEDDADAVWIRYSVRGVRGPIKLRLRPMIRCRPLHDLAVANPFLNGEVEVQQADPLRITMHPYAETPAVVASLHGVEGRFQSDGHWYHGVHYPWERDRGYGDAEDLFTPGEFRITIEDDGVFGARLGTSTGTSSSPEVRGPQDGAARGFLDQLGRAADAYIVELRSGRAGVIAGYPWFGEWSRDALISLPGLCLARDKVEDAVAILESLGARLEDGLVPNLPESGDVPSNTDAIDASLLFIRATALTAKKTRSQRIGALQEQCLDILEAILAGADPRVKVDEQGFLVVENGPWALTWMDAMIGGEPVTPRSGAAVDLNALWLSALVTASRWATKLRPALAPRLEETSTKLADHFEEKFWLQDEHFLTDTHDGERPDSKLRPNQLWALVLPGIPLSKAHKREALDAIRTRLLTPVGLRTLSPDDPAYRGSYSGGQHERDLAYHQGTVWPWLLGLYADAVRSIDGPEAANAEMVPIFASLSTHLRTEGCIGQIGELFDGDAPHRPGGAPAQAWSVAEILRVSLMADL
ncbi:MAG: amylo-alpha-1,6-glucosidase [Polyangiales bacterium]